MAIAMIMAATLVVAGGLSVHALAHFAILRGLRAPREQHDVAPTDVGLSCEYVCEVRIPGPHRKSLFGWLILPSAGKLPAPAVLVMHGWGANAAMMLSVVQPLHSAGFAVLLIDARCHGLSDDETFTSMPRFAEDIDAGLAWLRARSDIDPNRLALLGHSVGAAAALLHASRHHDIRAIVSLSAFAHPREVMLRLMAENRIPYPIVGWYVLRHVERIIGASFDNIAPMFTIGRVRCPMLLVHGYDDTIVPFSDAERLLRASTQASLLAVKGNHDLRQTLGPHSDTLVAFLQQHVNGWSGATHTLHRTKVSSHKFVGIEFKPDALT
jgi:uncharacterized protein